MKALWDVTFDDGFISNCLNYSVVCGYSEVKDEQSRVCLFTISFNPQTSATTVKAHTQNAELPTQTNHSQNVFIQTVSIIYR